MNPQIELTNFTKSFNSQLAVNDLTLSINKGEIFGFLGPNGAGKTTTIKALLGLLKPTTGSVKVLDKDPFASEVSWRKSVGFLSGDTPLYGNLNGKQYLRFVNAMQGGIHGEQQAKLCQILSAQLDKPLSKLSRGNKQKIGLIAALGHNPDLLILDEPTSGLDPITQHIFNQLIQERALQGVTVFLSSHVLSEVQELCGRVAFIRGGNLITIQDTRQLLGAQDKLITVSFSTFEDATRFSNSGVILDAVVSDNRVTGRTVNNINAVIGELFRYEVTDLRIELPDLEHIFMHYYESQRR